MEMKLLVVESIGFHFKVVFLFFKHQQTHLKLKIRIILIPMIQITPIQCNQEVFKDLKVLFNKLNNQSINKKYHCS